MIKLLRWILSAVLLFSFLGCGLGNAGGNSQDDQGYYDEEADDTGGDEGYVDESTPVGTANGVVGVFEAAECEYEDDYGVDLECGYVSVPENYDDLGGATVELAVTIIRSPGGARYDDPVVYLAGGPGGSATDDVESWLEQPFLADRDLILFDQRGTGWSLPSLNCVEVENANGDEETDATQACYNRLVDEGVALSQYNSAASAADLEVLRQALGYDEWNLLGVSYGTRLALTAMRDYPQGIRSVILDSVYPPEVDAYEEEPLNGVRAFEALLDDCAADAACNNAFPNLDQTLYGLLDDLDANPVEFTVVDPWTDEEVEVSLDGVELAAQLFQSFYDTATIPWIPYALDQMAQGNYEEAWILLLGGEETQDYNGFVLPRQGEDEDLTDSEGQFYSVECYEEIPFNSVAEAADLAAESDSPLIPYLMPDTNSVFAMCDIWDVGAAPAIEDRPVQSDIPALVLAGGYDPVTPPAWAHSAASHLPNSFYFELPGVGHGVVDTECGQGMIADFLNDPWSEPDSRCVRQLGAPEFQLP